MQNKVAEWLPMYAEFLDELIRYYGGETAVESEPQICSTCNLEPAAFRCSACSVRHVQCARCIIKKHVDLPLHAIKILQQWTSKMWKKTSLRELGFVFQLGHEGGTCPCPAPKTRRLVVGDVTGIHEVQVRFCECLDNNEQFTHQWVQVFRQGWFPATTNRPATTFTFRMLNVFQELNSQGKTTLYDYWRTLERVTDNSGSWPSLVLSHVVRLWRHLTALKRAGRGHDPTGPAGTQEGELAVECPACPHPGKNLLADWESAPPSIKWLYTLFLMVDANFRAKLKDRGFVDFELGSGWSYYVEQSKFGTHVDNIGNQNDANSCSAEHKAIQNANMRRQGYIASGVGAVLCAQHAMVRKTAVGDLPNGEKYLIMDYIVFSTILGLALMLLISYNIACQWHKKLARRAREDLPPHIQTNISKLDIRYAIPKKHIRVHGPKHSRFSLNFLRWVGRTYAEGIEAHWTHMNPLALSGREMGPGVRREHYNDHWGAWNWQKVIGFGLYLLRLLREADTMYTKQKATHDALSATFPAETIAKWDTEVQAWQENPKQAMDPYEELRTTATLKSTHLQIADEEAKELAAGTLPPHDISPGVFLQLGLDIEESQYVPAISGLIASELTSGHSSDKLSKRIQEKRNVLTRRIETWQGMQDLHMPIIPQFRSSAQTGAVPPPAPGATTMSSTPSDTTPTSHSLDPENVHLWLPSALPPVLRASLPPGLSDKERRLRIAQADDALEDIRRLWRILVGIADFKRLNISGTGQRTSGRVRTLFTKFQEKVKRAAERYRGARAALESLDNGGDWEARFKVLLDADLRGPGRESNDRGSEGRHQISWIWLVPRGTDQVSKASWTQTAERWGEEVTLLQEEMRRVIEYFDWKAGWWQQQAARRSNIGSALQRGLTAYAEFQASVFEGLASCCAHLWVPYFCKWGGAMPAWSARYNVPEKAPLRGSSGCVLVPSEGRAGTSVSTTLPEDDSSSSSGDSSDSSASDQE
ncbi:hypothetical protein C8T65DRAFT_590675 [Cerioporus squamosus]|nr:hypothetical protein C8T65DRAFT_590675 [Cerioporus squamosus]